MKKQSVSVRDLRKAEKQLQKHGWEFGFVWQKDGKPKTEDPNKILAKALREIINGKESA